MLYDFGFQVADLVISGRAPSRVFRVFVDRVDGGRVTLADCGAVARQVTLFLEMKGVYDQHCSLELGSAGLDRVLKRPRDFERYLGSEVRVTHHDGVRKETVTGELTSFNDEQLLLTPTNGVDGATPVRAISLRNIDRVQLVPKVEF